MTSRPAAADAPPQPAEPPAQSTEPPAQRRSLEATSALVPMLVLTFGTGVLDAATYLGLHGVFTANMTGNVIFIGLGLAGFETQVLLRAGLALAGFMAGAVAVGRAARGRPVHQHADAFSSWTLVVVALVITAMAALLSAGDLSARGLDAVTAVISAAMGAQAVAARRVGVPDVPTVVVTSAIVGLSADHRWSGRTHDRAVLLRRAGAVASMLVGAMVGALLLRMHIGVGVGTSALLLALVGLRGLVAARRARASG